MINTVIDVNSCTACGLCVDQCPVKCISFCENEYGVVYPVIDTEKCINCRKCIHICPVSNFSSKNLNCIKKVFVAWNKDSKTRFTSASGGAASGFYKYALSKDWRCVGVKFDNENIARMFVFSRNNFDENFRNSKYVYANPSNVYSKVIDILKENVPVLFIGLPCQIAAMKSIAIKENMDELLYTVDLICHGVASQKYLIQHIEHQGKISSFDKICFRDPKYGTSNFFFSLYKKNNLVYKKRVKSNDTYQVGYHKALIYRENCYCCKYARAERCSDITLGDFTGLATVKPYSGERTDISCVMLNSDKGVEFWNSVSSLFVFEKRPIEEALKDKQLQHPSIKPVSHEIFLNMYKEKKDFDYAVRKAIPKTMIYNSIYEILHIDAIKSILRKVKGWYCE